MSGMEPEEVEELLRQHPHLKRYVDSVQHKMETPAFFSALPREIKDEKYPNVIYPTKGSVFIHIYRTRDMDEKIYHSIEPALDEAGQAQWNGIS